MSHTSQSTSVSTIEERAPLLDGQDPDCTPSRMLSSLFLWSRWAGTSLGRLWRWRYRVCSWDSGIGWGGCIEEGKDSMGQRKVVQCVGMTKERREHTPPNRMSCTKCNFFNASSWIAAGWYWDGTETTSSRNSAASPYRFKPNNAKAPM